MSTSDGYVAGTTKIVDHGPDTARWNLVVVGDGYRASELANYHTHVQSFVDELRTTPPFNELFCGINVYRIDVVSNESGADDPGCAGGTPVTAKTYFDATFCSLCAGSPLDRLLTSTTDSPSRSPMPRAAKHQVLCIVNSTKYGGSGGTVATCSVDAQANKIAIHEIGHSAFGLADEYGGNGNGTPAGEPLSQRHPRHEPHHQQVARADRRDHADAVAMRRDLRGLDLRSARHTAAAGAVGTYEGAIYSDCNTYRPLPSCYMRDYARSARSVPA